MEDGLPEIRPGQSYLSGLCVLPDLSARPGLSDLPELFVLPGPADRGRSRAEGRIIGREADVCLGACGVFPVRAWGSAGRPSLFRRAVPPGVRMARFPLRLFVAVGVRIARFVFVGFCRSGLRDDSVSSDCRGRAGSFSSGRTARCADCPFRQWPVVRGVAGKFVPAPTVRGGVQAYVFPLRQVLRRVRRGRAYPLRRAVPPGVRMARFPLRQAVSPGTRVARFRSGGPCRPVRVLPGSAPAGCADRSRAGVFAAGSVFPATACTRSGRDCVIFRIFGSALGIPSRQT